MNAAFLPPGRGGATPAARAAALRRRGRTGPDPRPSGRSADRFAAPRRTTASSPWDWPARCWSSRLLDFVLFDVGFRLRRGTPAPELLRQLVSLLVFGLLLGILFKIELSVSLPALLTTSAIITAVLGLALQETLGNLFSGIALAMERTVQVGDMVRAGETIGLVEQLSWRAIKVRTMEGNALLIPNTVASRDRLEVFRRGSVPMARTMKVGLEYDLPPAPARAALEAAAADVRGVASHPGAGRLPRPLRRLLHRLRAALLARGLRALPRRRLARARARLVPARARGDCRSRIPSSASTSTPGRPAAASQSGAT